LVARCNGRLRDDLRCTDDSQADDGGASVETEPHESNHTATRVYDVPMRVGDAVDMLADSRLDALGPTSWADLGCGRGTFTLALAEQLAAGSTIHAVDLDASALRAIPAAHKSVEITTHRHDFTRQPWPFASVDGVLLANSLHYVEDQAAFIRACESQMQRPRQFVVVEYDTSEASRWVPFPVSATSLMTLFEPACYSSIRVFGRRASIYRREPLYAAVIGEAAPAISGRRIAP
jgi:SAM-dependent methyltransferase